MGDDVAAIRPGDVLAGRYRVERVIGRGGVAVVLAVTDLASDTPRAVKLLGRAARALPSTVERFFREARAMAHLTSEHAVRIFDVGSFDDGAPYLVMEHLEGADLAVTLRRRGALPAHEAALYVLHACEALAEAHEHGIVHRDLKPNNLFLTRSPDGGPCIKVLDFGFSKQLTLSERQRDITLANAVLGSPAYMSPEQLLSARAVDGRTDVWALGVVLYQLVTGQLPFSSDDAATLLKAVMTHAPARRPPPGGPASRSPSTPWCCAACRRMPPSATRPSSTWRRPSRRSCPGIAGSSPRRPIPRLPGVARGAR